MTKPTLEDFKTGRPASAFSLWLLSLEPGVVTAVPARFDGERAQNVRGGNSAVSKAGMRVHFRTVGSRRYVYTEKVK